MSSNNQKRLNEDDLRKMAVGAFEPHFKDLLKMDETKHLVAIDEKLRKFASANVKGISSSQLRKLYDEILTKKTAREIQLLRPIFAYTIARQNNNQAKQVMLLIDTLAKQLSEEEKAIAGFKRFMEALVAYHKYYEVTKS